MWVLVKNNLVRTQAIARLRDVIIAQSMQFLEWTEGFPAFCFGRKLVSSTTKMDSKSYFHIDIESKPCHWKANAALKKKNHTL